MRNFVTIQNTQGGKLLLNINYIIEVIPIDENSVSVIAIAGEQYQSNKAD